VTPPQISRRKAVAALLALAAGLPLAGCGKKARPKPPEEGEDTYQRTYPAPE
jgi:hypothetical protein